MITQYFLVLTIQNCDEIRGKMFWKKTHEFSLEKREDGL
jgi:hypothetical protein